MLINLLPDFLAVLESGDRVAAYRRYFETHRALLAAYWDNYVVDPDGAHFDEVVRAVVDAERDDLRALVADTDVAALAADAAARATELLASDVDVDVVVMVGVGAANAGELVIDGRGVAFVCLEHFTGVANPTTQGLGLDPLQLPLWVAHEITHAVTLHVADEPQRPARADRGGRRLLLVLGDGAPRGAARAPGQRGAGGGGRAPRRARAPAWSTWGTGAGSTRASASWSRCSRARSSPTWTRRDSGCGCAGSPAG
jgi:hypothetical protein